MPSRKTFDDKIGFLLTHDEKIRKKKFFGEKLFNKMFLKVFGAKISGQKNEYCLMQIIFNFCKIMFIST